MISAQRAEVMKQAKQRKGHKRQHWVSQCYLEAWVDPDTPEGHAPYVWVISREGDKIKRKAPENIFWETDMYTIPTNDGGRDLTLEHGLAGLEQAFATIRRRVLDEQIALSVEEHFLVCALIAATQSRTKTQRDHMQKQWGDILKRMDDVAANIKRITPEERVHFAPKTLSQMGEKDRSLDRDQVQELAQRPMQSSLRAFIRAQARIFPVMNMSVLCTEGDPGFITSDTPCVYFDPEAYKRPPMLQAPYLKSPSIEVTLPVSPRQLILLSWHKKFGGYYDIPDWVVDELNRRTRGHCDEYFIVRRNIVKDIWLDLGSPPPDDWRPPE